MAMLLLVVGTTLLVAGVVCGAVAAYGTHRRFGAGPLLPRAHTRARRWWVKIRRVLLRRPPPVVTGTMDASLPALEGSMRGRVVKPPIPTHADVSQKVALLIRRLQRLEQKIESIQRENADTREATRSEIETLRTQLEAATSALTTRINAMVLGSVPLQMLGLFLTAVGTIMVAVPSLFGS